MPCGWSARSRWNWQLPPIAPDSSVLDEMVGTSGSIEGSPHWGLDEAAIEGLALFVPAWAHFLPTVTWDSLHCLAADRRLSKNPGMPSQYLICPEMAISHRIHLWEGKSASNRPCERSNASPDRCGPLRPVGVAPKNKPSTMFSCNVQSIELLIDCTTWRFWTMRQSNGCSKSAPRSSAA